MLSKGFIQYLEDELEKVRGSKVEIKQTKRELGGDINDAFKIESNQGEYFIKINDAVAFPTMFEAEAKGLTLLKEKTSFVIPKAIINGEFENKSFLLLEYLPLQSNGNWVSFGEKLAEMHKISSPSYGLDYPNYIGSLFQENKEMDSWADFYMKQRILPLSTRAFDLGLLNSEDLKNLDSLSKELPSIYPIEKPSLLHGDLWSGNASFCEGKACIYDPALYFGHREMDIGMTLLFGGFSKAMFESYNSVYALEKGWQNRVEISQLYPLLVHLVLFGGSYAKQVKAILKKHKRN